jgi:hypothetical protein
MSKYNIEGGIDFFSELYKSLDIEENEQKTDEDNNICLITNQQLQDKFVELECGHKFNYIPLFNDLKNHKQKFNNMEGGNTKLKTNEIRCPYCRNKQEGVLPYYDDLNLSKINGVNYYNPTLNTSSNNDYTSNYPKCKYLTPNAAYNPDAKYTIEIASKHSGKNCKFFSCICCGSYQISQFIPTNDNLDMIVCHLHKNKMIKEYNINLKNKEKEEKQKAKEELKQKAKEEKQKAKEEKQKAKEEKQKSKKYIKQNKIKENEVVGTITIQNDVSNNLDSLNNNTNEGCIEIIKSGSKKGLQCGAKKHDDYRCKRHFNLLFNKCLHVEENTTNLTNFEETNNS